jgi:hypothetical protein
MIASASAISLYVGYVEGKIVDESGAPLERVRIVLAPQAAEPKEATQTAPAGCEELSKKKGAQSAKTGSNGKYKFVAVRPGNYTICFGLEGYQTIVKKSEIKQAVTNTFDITLKRTETPPD